MVLSSDGLIAQDNLVVLKDDRHLQNADNVVALFRSTLPKDAQDILNKVDAALTTEKLQELNGKAETKDPKDLAAQFLKDAGLA